jgi:putative ABC transport system substrate-binding protein
MKPNKAFSLAILFLGVGYGAGELGARMALHCDFRGRERQTTPMAVKILKGIKSTDIPSQIPLSHRLTLNLKTAKQLGMTINPDFLSLAHRVIE